MSFLLSQSTEKDLSSCQDEDSVGTPSVSFAEFLQQYKELTDWLNQVHKVTQREVTSMSEKYLNQVREAFFAFPRVLALSSL